LVVGWWWGGVARGAGKGLGFFCKVNKARQKEIKQNKIK
jgi:hypothetical protein